MKLSKTKLATAIAAFTAVTLSTSSPAAVLEEIVITSQKRKENLQDVGISVSAFSGEQLDGLGITNTTDIIQQIPGLQLQSFTAAFTAFNLRGISQNNFQDNLEAPVAVYVNDAYVGSINAINGQLFDMDRVEVLRGPQGTLFGRNATGGLIHYVTKHADEEELNGYLETSFGNFDTRSVEGAIGGALTDGIRARLSARWEEADGYVENQVGNRDSHGKDGYAVRGSFQFDLSESTVADLIVSYAKDDDVPTGTYVIQAADVDALGLAIPEAGAPEAEPNESFDDGGFYDRETTSVTLNVDWEVNDSMTFTSVTNHLDLDKFYLEDADGTTGSAPGPFFEFSTDADYKQFSQEFRLSGVNEGFRWQAGVYYLDIQADLEFVVDGNIVTPAFNTAVNTTDLDSQNWSIFGQVEYDLSDQWTLIAGYRWSQDDKDIDFQTTDDSRNPDGSDDGTPPVLNPLDISAVDSIDYGDYAARLQLNYSTEDDLYFFSINRGIKGGNWSPNRDVDISNFRHDEEVLYAYELGTKQQFADGSARLNATIFYYDYEDYQQFSLLNATPQVVNRDATNLGGEIELFLTPGEGWDIAFGVSIIDSEVDGAPTAFGIDNEDVDLPNAPEYSINGLIRYAWPALGGELAVQLDGVQTGEQFLEGTNNPSSEEDSYFVGNISTSYTSEDERWKVSAWVKNVTDEEYRLYHLDLAVLDVFIDEGFGFTQEVYAPPRTYGVTLSYNFGNN